jgi:hypothetical protein
VGKDLSMLMRYNRDLLVNRYSKLGAVVIDNLEAVPGKHFGEKNWTTEHYDQTGRAIIAKNVCKALASVPRKK